jgi:hypothetical protein
VDILPHLNDETVAAYAGRKGLPQDQGCYLSGIEPDSLTVLLHPPPKRRGFHVNRTISIKQNNDLLLPFIRKCYISFDLLIIFV